MPAPMNKLKSLAHFGMASKLTVAICLIVALLVVSEGLSIMEFEMMSTHVSDQISDDIENINLSTELGVVLDEFNLSILSEVGNADSLTVSTLDSSPYISVSDSVLAALMEKRIPNTDSLQLAYDSYIAVSKQLDSVIVSDFVDSRDWYFTQLQPQYTKFRWWQDMVNKAIYRQLRENSVSFDESFYRSITPGMVSVVAGIVLCLLLLFFVLVYYVRPLKKMLVSLNAYRNSNIPYRNVFEGNDELQELNGGIADIVEENRVLKRRIRERERER